MNIKPDALKTPCVIDFVAQKTGKPGAKVIDADLFDRLKKNGNDVWCFPSPRNAHNKRTRQAVYYAMRRAADYYGFPRASPHSARKAYAVELARREGFDAVAKELQHSHEDTTLIYALADVLEERAKKRKNEEKLNKNRQKRKEK